MRVFSNVLHESTNPTHLSALNKKFSPSSSPSRKCVGYKTRGHVSDRNSNERWVPYPDGRVCLSTYFPFLPILPYRTAEVLGRSSLCPVPSVCAVVWAWSRVTTIHYPLRLGHEALQRFHPEDWIHSLQNHWLMMTERSWSWTGTG